MTRIAMDFGQRHGLLTWEDYKDFSRYINPTFLAGLSRFFSYTNPSKQDVITLRKISPSVKELHDWCDSVKNEKKVFSSTMVAIYYRLLDVNKDGYFLGLDLMYREGQDFAQIAMEKGLEVKAWRFGHESFVRRVDQLGNLKDIENVVLECSANRFSGV